jgi:hypothetical protein
MSARERTHLAGGTIRILRPTSLTLSCGSAFLTAESKVSEFSGKRLTSLLGSHRTTLDRSYALDYRHADRFIALSVVLIFFGPQPSRGEDGIVHLSEAQVEAIPVWATFVASEESAPIVLRVPDHFTDEIIHGAIIVKNDLDEKVRLGTVETSCGCTAVKQINPELAAKSEQRLLCQIVKNRPVDFTEKIRFQFAGEARDVTISGIVRPRIHAKSSIEFATDGSASVDIEVLDDSIVPETFVVDPGPAGLEVSARLTDANTISINLNKTDREWLPESIRISLRFGLTQQYVLTIPATHLGRMRIVPSVVYFQTGKPIRLYVIGDLSAFSDLVDQESFRLVLKDTSSGQMTFDQIVKTAVVQAEKSVSLTIEDPDAFQSLRITAEQNAQLHVGKTVISFRARVKD